MSDVGVLDGNEQRGLEEQGNMGFTFGRTKKSNSSRYVMR